MRTTFHAHLLAPTTRRLAALALFLQACSPHLPPASERAPLPAEGPAEVAASPGADAHPADTQADDAQHDDGEHDAPQGSPIAELADAGAPAATPVEAEPAPNHDAEPYRQALPEPLVTSKSPALRYANLSPWQCKKELARRKLPLQRQRETKGIATALRFTAPMNGVRFITAGPKSPFSLLDCRLALTLDDLTKVLNDRGVVGIRVDNFYRRAARLPGSRKRSQHAYGLAIDMTELELADGRVLNVEAAWGAPIGVPPCGPGARVEEGLPDSLTLRNLVCLIAAGGHFHHILTPAYDRAHRNHLHLDIKRGTKYGIIR